MNNYFNDNPKGKISYVIIFSFVNSFIFRGFFRNDSFKGNAKELLNEQWRLRETNFRGSAVKSKNCGGPRETLVPDGELFFQKIYENLSKKNLDYFKLLSEVFKYNKKIRQNAHIHFRLFHAIQNRHFSRRIQFSMGIQPLNI